MVDDVSLVNSVTTRYLVEGIETSTAALDRIMQAEARLTAQSGSLSAASAGLDRSTLSVQRSLDAYTRSLDPAAKALSTYERGLSLANRAVEQGAPLTDAQARALAAAKDRWIAATGVANDNAGAVGAHGRAVTAHTGIMGLNNIQVLEATHVAKAFTEQIIAGQDPLRALALEGGRITTFFQMGDNGVGGTLQSVGTIVGKLANPFVLATASLAAFGAAAVVASTHYRELHDQLDRAVSGAGRVTGLTGAGLGDLAAGAAQRTGLALGDAQSIASGFAASGHVSAGNISSLLGLVPGYAAGGGLSASDAGQKLASLAGDPVKLLDELGQRYGFVDDALRQHVKSLQDQGRAQDALRLVTDASSASLNEMVKPQGPFDRFMAQFSRRNAEIEAGLARLTSGPTAMQQYVGASRIADSQSLLDRLRGSSAADPSSDLAETFRHAAMLAGASPLMRSQQADVLANQQSTAGADVVRSVLPDIERFQTMVDQQKKLQDAIANPDALARMGVTADQARDALDRLNTGLATFQTAAQQIASNSSLAIASIQAETFADKQAAEDTKTYVETLQRTHSALEAGAAAEARRNEAIATANRQADDAARQQRQSNALIGLRPAQQLDVERRQAIDNAGRDYGSGPVAGRTMAAPVTAAQQRMFSVLVGAGYSPAAAAGFVGGLTGESGINLSTTTINPTSGATGMMQALGSRKDALLSQSSPYDFDAQAKFVLAELNGSESRAGELLRKATTVQGGLDANIAYERPYAGSGMTQAQIDADYAKRLAAGGALAGTSGAVSPGGYVGGISGAYAPAAVQSSALATSVQVARETYDKRLGELTDAPLRNAQDTLAQQKAAEAILEQTSALQRTGPAAAAAAGQIATLNERQNLLNEYMKAGVDIAPDLRAKIDAVAKQYGDAATAAASFQQNQERIVGAMDSVRSAARDGLGTFVDDLIRGKSAGEAFRDTLASLGSKILSLGEDMLINSLFGKSGTTGGGLLGGGLSSIFSGLFGGIGHNAGGTDDWRGGPTWVGEKGPEIVNLPRGAQVVPNSVATARAAPSISFGGHQVIIQGNADKDTADLIDRKIQAANVRMMQHVTRTFQSIQADSQQYAA